MVLVTSGKFTSYPLTAKEAEKAGWKKDATYSGTKQTTEYFMCYSLIMVLEICYAPRHHEFISLFLFAIKSEFY